MEVFIARYYERLYRFALLVTGNEQAAIAAVVAAFRKVDPQTDNPEAALLAALLPAPEARWRFRAPPATLQRAGLTSQQADTLIAALARLTPAVRHSLGMLVFIEKSTPIAPRAWIDLAVALGQLPSEVDRLQAQRIATFINGDLPAEHALAVRGELLADEGARAIREGLVQTEAMLRQALPALFAVEPPPHLLSKLEKPARQEKRRGMAKAQLITIGVVMACIATLLGLPELWQALRPTFSGSATTASTEPAGQVIEQALGRLAAPTPIDGLLHERYTIELGGESWLLERWLEPQAPHRLAVRITNDDDLLHYGMTLNEEGRLQFRLLRGESSVGYDFRVSDEQLDRMLPTLRQQPDNFSFFWGAEGSFGLDRWYLAQARNNNPTNLGLTTFDDRRAHLVSFRTTTPYPPDTRQPPEQNSTPAQVILTIDQVSLAVLDVQVSLVGNQQTTIERPWRAEVVEQVTSVPSAVWELAPASRQGSYDELPSPRLFTVSDNETILSVAELSDTLTETIYLPNYSPERTTEFVIGEEGDEAVFFREGANSFTAIFWLPSERRRSALPEGIGTAQQAGEHYYYLLQDSEVSQTGGLSIAMVGIGAPEAIQMQIIFGHQYLSDEEREQMLATIIASLEPLDGSREEG
jgi:hypothetical protein